MPFHIAEGHIAEGHIAEGHIAEHIVGQVGRGADELFGDP
jgi:hypothetical protein